MTGILHPSTMTKRAGGRPAELLAETDHSRLAQRVAEADGVCPLRWADLALGVGAVLALTLPMLASPSG